VHVQCGHPDLFRRNGPTGWVGRCTARLHRLGWPMGAPRLGPERARWYNAWKTMRECGVHLSGGSDAPVEPFNPLWGSPPQ
jgi:predicted amidohydrolase YtcJ